MALPSGRTWAAIGVMLILAAFQLLEGIRAVIVGGTFVDGTGFAYRANNTAFGWLHIALGALVALSALALVSGRAPARAMAVVAVILTAVAAFFWIPYLPVFALLIIAFSVFVIWAATTARTQRAEMREMEEQEGMGHGGYGDAQTGERWPSGNAPSGRRMMQDNKQPAGETQAQMQERHMRERANAEARASGMPPNNPPQSGHQG